MPRIFNPPSNQFEPYDVQRHARNPIWGFDIETNALGLVAGAEEFPLSISFQPVHRRGRRFNLDTGGIDTLVYPPGTTQENYLPEVTRVLGEKITTGRNRGKTLGELTGLKPEMWAERGAITQEQLAEEIDRRLSRPGRTPVLLGQNIQNFDTRVLSGVLERAGKPTLNQRNVIKYDVWERAQDYEMRRGQLNNVRHFNLAALAQRFNVPYATRHEAGADLRATVGVANAIEFGNVPSRGTSRTTGRSMPPRPPSNVAPPGAPPRPPSGLNLFRPSFESPQGGPDLEDFADFTASYLAEANKEGVTNEVRRTIFKDQGFVRFGIYAPGEDNPIVLDLKPGPRDRRGERTLVEHYPSGWIGNWEPQIFAESAEKLSLMPTGFDTLQHTVRQALTSEELISRIPDSPQKRFNVLKYEGSKDLGVVGRHQQQGPPHPSTFISQAVSKVSIGYGLDVEDTGEANRNIMRRIAYAAKQVETLGISAKPRGELTSQERDWLEWSRLAGYVPTKEEGDTLTRLSPLYHAQVEDEELRAWGLGRKDIDAIKRASLQAGRERAFFYEQVKEGGVTSLRPATPEPVTGRRWEQRAGLRYATIPEWGEPSPEAAVVLPETVMTAATPLSGALMMYRDPLKGRKNKIITAGYQTTRGVELPTFPMDTLRDIRFKFGVMREMTNEEGEVTGYEEVEPGRGLKGVTLREEASHIIGYYQMGKKGPQIPLRMNVEGAPVTINEDPRLLIPSHYMPGSFEPSGGYGPVGTAAPEPATEVARAIRRRNQGLQVVPAGGPDETRLLMDIGLHVGTGGKGYGVKESVFEIARLKTDRYQQQRIEPAVTLTGPRGTETRKAAGITGEIKDWTQQFAASFRFTEANIQSQWIGELGRLEEEIPGMQRTAQALQTRIRENVGAGRTTRPEELADIYAQTQYGEEFAFKGEDTSAVGRLYWTEMMARLRYATEEKMPATQAYQQYGWAKAGEQWLPLFPTTTGERTDIMQSALGGVAMAMQERGLPFLDEATGKVSKEGARAFKSVFPGGMREFVRWERTGNQGAPWKMLMKAPASTVLGTHVMYPEPEFMGGTPHLGMEEILGLETQFAQIAEFTGMTSALGPEGPERSGYGFRTNRIKAYKQMADVVRYQMSRLPSKPRLAGRTIGAEEAQELIAWINMNKNAEQPLGIDFEKLEEKLGSEPLLLPETVQNRERAGSAFISPTTIKNISYSPFPWESQYYNPVDRITRTYLPSLVGFLSEAAGGRESPTTARFEGEMRDIFRRATDTLKNLQSYQSGQVVGGRFGAATGIGLGTSIISEQTLNRVLRAAAGQAGIGGDKAQYEQWRRAAMKQITEMGGIPTLDTRYPFQSREAGWMATMAMTPRMLAERTGVQLPEASILRGSQIIPGSAWQSGIAARLTTSSRAFSGDWDLDTLLKLFGVMANPQWQEEGQQALRIPEQLMQAVNVTEGQRSKDINRTLEQLLGSSAGHPGGRFDVVAKQWVDIINAVAPDAESKTRATAQGRGSTSTTYEEAYRLAEAYIGGGKGGMGAEFNLQRMLTAQAGVLGIGDKIRTVSGVHYQVPLDFMYDVFQQRGGQSRLQTLMQSAIIGNDQNVMNLLAMPQAKARHTELWREGQDRNIVTEELAVAAQADIEEIQALTGQKPNRQFAGALFAQRQEDIEWISSRFEEETARNQDRALPRTIQAYAGYLGEQGQNFNIWDTTIGRTLISSALLKISPYRPGGKGPRQVTIPDPAGGTRKVKRGTLQVLGGREMEWGEPGQRIQLQDLMNVPGIQAGLITYQHMTRGGIVTPEDVALIQRFREQRITSGRPVPKEWMHLTALYGGPRDVEAVERAQATARAELGPQEILQATRAQRSQRIMVSGSQIPRLMMTEREQEVMGLEPEWTESAFEKLLAQNTMGWGGEAGITPRDLDALFSIPEAAQRRGKEFERQAQEYATREYGLQNAVMNVPHTKGVEINLENVLTTQEQGFIPPPYRMGMRMTPDILGLTPEGRMMVGEAKAGTSQMQTGQVQAFTYAFMLQRLAGWDPMLAQPFQGGGRRTFTPVMRKLLAAGNPLFRRGTREYREGTNEQREAILEQYYQAASQGNVDIRMLQGEPGGPTNQWLLDREPTAEGMGYENAYAFMFQGLRNAVGFYENEQMVTATQARLARRVALRPELGIPATAAMQSAAATVPDRRRDRYQESNPLNDVRRVAEAGPGGPGEPPQEPPTTAATPEEVPPSGRGPSRVSRAGAGFSGDQVRMLVEAVEAIKNVSDAFVRLANDGIQIHHGSSRQATAGWAAKLAGFRNLYNALETEGAQDFTNLFQQEAAGGLVGTPEEMIAEAASDRERLRGFVGKNWNQISRLAKLAKRATGIAANLRQVESAQDERSQNLPVERLLEPWERSAIPYIAGFSVTPPPGGLAHGHPIEQMGNAAQLAFQIMNLAKDLDIQPRGRGSALTNLQFRSDLPGEQQFFLAMNESMLENRGTGFMSLSAAQRKHYLAQDRMMVSQWKREFYESQERSMLEGGEPAPGEAGYERLIRLRTQLKGAQDTELASIEKERIAREKLFISEREEPFQKGGEAILRGLHHADFDRQLQEARARNPLIRNRIADQQRATRESQEKLDQLYRTLPIEQQAAMGTLASYGVMDLNQVASLQPELLIRESRRLEDQGYREDVLMRNIRGRLPSRIQGMGLQEAATFSRRAVTRMEALSRREGMTAEQQAGLTAGLQEWSPVATELENLASPTVQEAMGKQAQALTGTLEQRLGLPVTQRQLTQISNLEERDLRTNLETERRLAGIMRQHQARKTAIGRRYATDRNLTEGEEVTQKYETAIENIDTISESYNKEIEGLLQQLDDRELGTLAQRVRRATGTRARARAGEVVQRAIQGRVTRGEALQGEEEIGQELVKRLYGQEDLEVQREEAGRQFAEYTSMGRFGTMARRMFGGFGLMYMRSIGGLVTTGAYTGYGERMQEEAAMAGQFLGVGGQMPVTPTERLQRISAVQYGGQGGLAMTSARAALMERQQALYQAGTLGIAGISAAGMATWALGPSGMGMTAQAANAAAIPIGLGIMAGSAVLGTYGALQDVPGTAMAEAYKQIQGRQTGAEGIMTNVARLGTIGGVVGGVIGGVAGAFAGGVGAVPGAAIGMSLGTAAGAALGAMASQQEIAEALSPEIRQQKEILAQISADKPAAEVLRKFGIPEEQAAYYTRMAAMIKAPQEGWQGIGEEAIAGTMAFELRRGVVGLGDQERQRIARQMQGGYNIEALAMMMGQARGLTVQQMNVPIQPPPIGPTGGVTIGAPLWAPTNQTTFLTQQAMAISSFIGQGPQQAQRAEQLQAAAEAIGGFGVVGQEGVRDALKEAAINARRKLTPTEELEAAVGYGGQLDILKQTGWASSFLNAKELQARQRAVGMPVTPMPTVEEFAQRPASLTQQTAYMRQLQEAAIPTSMVEQWRQMGMQTFGQLPQIPYNPTPLEIQQGMTQISAGGNIAQQMLLGGMGGPAASMIGSAFQNMNPSQFRQYQGLFTMNPLQVAGWAMQNQQAAAGLMAGGTLPGLGGTQIEPQFAGMADINAGGLTGLAWGTTSLALPMQVASGMTVAQSSANVAGQIWGNWQGRTDVSQGLINAMIQGGQFGGQAYQQMIGAQYQQQAAGNQMAMLLLQEKYQPQFWALEDKSRNLGYRQTEWGFQQQEAQLEMQSRFFNQNFALNVQQAQMQRQWTREDWGFQDTQRAMQWGWRQEDFAEQVRFMTGRERKLAERGMERETITFGMEGDRIDTQRKRQEELWGLEDARFAIAKSQHEEQRKFQEDAIEKQREFFQERKKIEEQQVALQRAYWKEQHELQKQAAGAAAAYAAKQVEIAKTMQEFSQWSAKATAKGNLFNPETLATLGERLVMVDPLFRSFIKDIEELIKLLGGKVEKPKTPSSTPKEVEKKAGGGPTMPGEWTVVGDEGPELIRSPYSVSVLPNNLYKAMQYGAEFQDPWNNTSMSYIPPGGNTQNQTVNVYLGNEKLGTFVIDAVRKDLEVG